MESPTLNAMFPELFVSMAWFCIATALFASVLAIYGSRLMDALIEKIKLHFAPVPADPFDPDWFIAHDSARSMWEKMRASQTYAGVGQDWFLGFTHALYLLDTVTEHEWISVQNQAEGLC